MKERKVNKWLYPRNFWLDSGVSDFHTKVKKNPPAIAGGLLNLLMNDLTLSFNLAAH